MAETNNTIKTTVVLDTTQTQQKIIKLGAVASDSTRELEERTKAKNEQVKLQNKLAQQTIANLEAEKKALQKLGNKEKEVAKIEIKLNRERIKATKISENGAKAQRKLNKQLADSKDSMALFDKATGGLISKFGNFKKGLKAVQGGFKGIGGAIALSGLGLLALIISGVIQAFKNSEEGQNKFAKIMGVIGAVTGNFVDIVADLGDAVIEAFENPKESIESFIKLIKENIINRFEGLLELIPQLGKAIKLLFAGEFAEAGKVAVDAAAKVGLGVENITDKIDGAVEAIKTFTKEQIKEGKAAAAVADRRAKADKLERKLLVERAKLENEISQLKLKSREEEKFGASERAGFLKEAQVIEDALLKQEKEVLELRKEAIQIENTFSRSSKENLDAQAQAEAAVFKIQAARTNAQITTQRQLNRLNKEAAADAARIRKETKDAEDKVTEEKKERNLRDIDAQIELDTLLLEQKILAGENTLAAELAILERRKNQELAIADLTASEKALIEEKYSQASAKITKSANDAKTKSNKAGAEAAIGFAAEAFGIQKEVAVAEMIMNAPQAIGNVWANAAKQPALPLVLAHGIGGTAVTLAPIIKGLSDIKKTRFPGKKKGGGASAGGSISSSTSGGAAPISTEAVADIAANNAARLGIDPNVGAAASNTAASNVSGGSGSEIVFSENRYNDFQNQVDFKEEKISV